MLTTLELARKITDAVLEVEHGNFGGQFAFTDAIFRVLRENDSWFCRMPKDDVGETQLEAITPYEQLPLF